MLRCFLGLCGRVRRMTLRCGVWRGVLYVVADEFLVFRRMLRRCGVPNTRLVC
jgi:hypothetical protein